MRLYADYDTKLILCHRRWLFNRGNDKHSMWVSWLNVLTSFGTWLGKVFKILLCCCDRFIDIWL